MVNDSIRMDRIFASMSDKQIAKMTAAITRVVRIVISIAAIGTGIIVILGRHHN